ncbi:MAG: ABC transporter ATP-binding protein [Halobacteria archaeon]
MTEETADGDGSEVTDTENTETQATEPEGTDPETPEPEAMDPQTTNTEGTDPVLSIRDVEKSFGGVVAADDLSFDVERGTVTGLIGPNGAGKTTLFDMVSGFLTPDSGKIIYDGTPVRELTRPDRGEQGIWTGYSALAFGGFGYGVSAAVEVSPILTLAGAALGVGIYHGQRLFKERRYTWERRPYRLYQEGLVRTFQISRELDEMTVLDNMALGPKNQYGENVFNSWFRRDVVDRQERGLRHRAAEILEFLEIDHLSDETAGSLSGGQRKLLELGRVLMTDPELILLDEPVAGVNPRLSDKLADRILELKQEGYSFLVIEHDIDVITRLSDKLVVMDQGSKVVEGEPEKVLEDERVVDAYLGGDPQE